MVILVTKFVAIVVSIVRDVMMLRGYLAGGVGLGAIHVFGTHATQWEEPVVAP